MASPVPALSQPEVGNGRVRKAAGVRKGITDDRVRRLIEDNYKLAVGLAVRAGQPGDPTWVRDLLYDAAVTALIDAAPHYDPELGEPKPFVATCVCRRLTGVRRRYDVRVKFMPYEWEEFAYAFDAEGSNGKMDRHPVAPGFVPDRPSEFEFDAERAFRGVDPDDLSLVREHCYEGREMRDIGNDRGYKAGKVFYRIHRAYKVIQESYREQKEEFAGLQQGEEFGRS